MEELLMLFSFYNYLIADKFLSHALYRKCLFHVNCHENYLTPMTSCLMLFPLKSNLLHFNTTFTNYS